MLLIDEIDRADEEFEAFLLEVLSDFQITIPELGTIRARRRPAVILTSNRTRELHDALKRRALFHWIGHPSIEREIEIVKLRIPGIPERLAAEAAAFVRELRGLDLAKPPGVAETIDWAMALNALGRQEIDAEVVEQTLGSVLKYREDIEAVRDETLARPRRAARAAAGPVAASMAERRARPARRHLRPRAARGRPRGRPGPRRRRAARRSTRSSSTRQEDVYFALRQTLVSRHDELDLFDRAFTAWFLRAPVAAARAARRRRGRAAAGRRDARRAARAAPSRTTTGGDPIELGASGHELLREKDFAEMTPDEFGASRRLIAAIAEHRPRRASRRRRARPARRPARHAPPDPAVAAHGRRSGRPALPRPQAGAAQARRALRRLGLDGRLRARARCCSCTPPSARARASRRSRSARG